ncbi:MAG: Ig-like domain-containing domain [Paludibacteraceae bacterium]
MKRITTYFGGIKALIIYLLGGALALSCANRGSGPQGGPKDIAPPIPVGSKPENGARNYNKPTVEINFNEIVLLEKAYEKVVVSPPQAKSAIVKAYGKKVTVELLDSLKSNRTYIIDFADAIVDNNEKNPLKDYFFTFATGDELDSLMLGGTVIDAHTLNPTGGIVVGLHSNLTDSAFTTQPFDYITKTNDEGQFRIKGIAAGSYKVYALGDMNSNFTYDKGESMAFWDSIIVPAIDLTEEIDTIWRDSVTIDTVITHTHRQYTSDIILRSFTEDFKRAGFIKAERPEPYKMVLYFNAPNDSMPHIEPLNFVIDSTCRQQTNDTRDTLVYWFADTLLWQQDTLSYMLTYQKTDSLDQLAWQTDTLQTVYRAKKSSNKKNTTDDKHKQKTEFLKLQTNASGTFDLYNPINLSFDVPTTRDTTKRIAVELQIDTLWQPVPATFVDTDTLGRHYRIDYAWEPEKKYRITIDSAAFTGINGLHTNTYESTISIKSLESYATFYLILKHLEGNEIVELLDKDEQVVRTAPAEAETVFKYLNPGDYFLRLFIDTNGNGRWDTGLYDDKRQPEDMFYFQYKITMRAFWDIEETWDYRTLPLTQQKPKELSKNNKKKK